MEPITNTTNQQQTIPQWKMALALGGISLLGTSAALLYFKPWAGRRIALLNGDGSGTPSRSQLNQIWLDQSLEAGRSIIRPEDLKSFLDPNVPLDALFEKVEPLGSGAFGSVGLWVDKGGEKYAVKEFHKAVADYRDFEIGLKLDSPYFVKTYHFVNKINPETGTKTQYLIMEYIEGTTLRNSLLTSDDRQLLMREAIDSFSEALHQGIVPFDLHDRNVMVTKDGHLKWIDLGLYVDATQEEVPLVGVYTSLNQGLRSVGSESYKPCPCTNIPWGQNFIPEKTEELLANIFNCMEKQAA